MDRKEADILLDKYYRGETSLEEEKALRDYFTSGGGTAPGNEAERALFGLYGAPGEDLEEGELEGMIDELELETIRPVRNLPSRRRLYRIAALAASVAIVLGGYFGYVHTRPNRNDAALAGTFSGNPALAYQETQRVLLYVSGQFNKGTSQLSSLSKLNEPAEQLKSLRTFDKGLSRLKLLNQLDNEPKEKN